VPVILRVQVTVEMDVVKNIDESVVVYEVTEAVKKFVNGLLIGESLLISDVIVMLKRMSYINDVKIPNQENISITTSQIARFENCEVTVAIG
jgi:hypothetical protein